MIPVATILGPLMADSRSYLIVEQIFALDGLGRKLVESVGNREYFLLTSITLIMGLFLVLGNLAVDVLYAWLESTDPPRLRYLPWIGFHRYRRLSTKAEYQVTPKAKEMQSVVRDDLASLQVAGPPRVSRGPVRDAWRQFRGVRKVALVGALFILLVVTLAVLAPWATPYH